MNHITSNCKTILLFVVVLILFQQHSFSQVPIVKYDFKTNRMDSILPFDQRFNIKFKDEDKKMNWDSVFITFLELPNTEKIFRERDKEYRGKEKEYQNRKKIYEEKEKVYLGKEKDFQERKQVYEEKVKVNLEKDKESLDKEKASLEKEKESLDKEKISFEKEKESLENEKICWKDESLVTLTDQELFTYSKKILKVRTLYDTTSKNVSIPFQLKYNRDYFTIVGGSKNIPISKAEKEELKEHLSNMINNKLLLGTTIRKMSDGDSGRKLDELFFNFQIEIKTMIKSINPEYNFSTVSADTIKKRRDRYQDSFVLFFTAYDHLRSHLKNNKKDAIELFDKINWESITKDDVIFKSSLSGFEDEDSRNLFRSDIDKAIEHRDKLLTNVTDFVDDVFVSKVTINKSIAPTYHNSLTENATLYFTADLGYIYNYYLDDLFPTLSLTFYPRPVNPNLPFSHYTGWDKLWTRIGIVAGTTLASVYEEGKRKGVIGDKALILGLGYRFLPFAKIMGGCMFFKSSNTNPLISNYHTTATWFAGVSLDVGVANLVKNTFNTK